ncbi:MAG TPA: prepilin-type N-terminal cleavage/methylation domain-containing protein [Candidatus Saccharimonadales bacterium]|nr:prepilin-type N-terminal cleavage/methylation domain-containing protein [Candidatus Saccharimonadales bacterium]
MRTQNGYSITELLIVIVTIGILATITIVSYNGFQNRANDAAIQSDLEGMAGLLEAYRNRDDDSNPSHIYPQSSSTLESLDLRASKNSYDTSVSQNLVLCMPSSGNNAYKEYRLAGLSKSGNAFVMGQDGFITHSLTKGSFSGSLCSVFSMSEISSGLSAPDTWQNWVKS